VPAQNLRGLWALQGEQGAVLENDQRAVRQLGGQMGEVGPFGGSVGALSMAAGHTLICRRGQRNRVEDQGGKSGWFTCGRSDARLIPPDFGEAYIARALAYEWKGERQKALTDFRGASLLYNTWLMIRVTA
jgi:hypothetical protein